MALVLPSACRSETEREAEKRLAELKLTPEDAKKILAEISTKRAEHEPPPLESTSRSAPTSVSRPPSPELPKADTAWIVDELEDVGPAAPSAASHLGVFLVNGANELFLAKLGSLPDSVNPQASPLGVVPDVKGPFALGRGPAFTSRYAYWVTSHFLLRRPVVAPYGPLEIIAEDARVGTRPSAVTVAESAAVAYIALPKVKDGPLRARVWTETQPPKTAVDLTDSGNSTLSVSLVPWNGGALALSLEARMGVTALHARPIDVKKGTLGPDDVPWIGGTAQPLTEVRSLGKHETFFTFLAMEQDSAHFGLAILTHTLGNRPPSEAWLTFPNGLDPAPVSAASACSKDLVLFARPSEPTPKAPQELVLAELRSGTLVGQTVLSRARAYYDVSLAEVRGGALVSFVADQRTWARTVRCPGARRR